MTTISFWDIVPKPSFLTALYDFFFRRSATPAICRLQTEATPAEVNYQLLTADQSADADSVADFLRANYNTGSACKHPISNISSADLLVPAVRTVYLQLQGRICGCISSLPLGTISRGAATSAFNLRLIQNFCVDKQLRKKGIGNKLLHAIWKDTRSIGEDATIFLKEGAPLLIAGPPLYSSRWVYRRCLADEGGIGCQQIPTCSPSTSYLIDEFVRRSESADSIIYNTPITASNTVLILYKGIRGQILVAFASAKQLHPSDNKAIWYQTGWLEQGTILQTERQFAAKHISSKCASITGCGWIWLDVKVFKDGGVPLLWKNDGPFHYYAFHWTASLYNNSQLFLRF